MDRGKDGRPRPTLDDRRSAQVSDKPVRQSLTSQDLSLSGTVFFWDGRFVEGHGFSRAVKPPDTEPALAAEVKQEESKNANHRNGRPPHTRLRSSDCARYAASP